MLSKDTYPYLIQSTENIWKKMIFEKNKGGGVSHPCPKFAILVLFYPFWSGAEAGVPPNRPNESFGRGVYTPSRIFDFDKNRKSYDHLKSGQVKK